MAIKKPEKNTNKKEKDLTEQIVESKEIPIENDEQQQTVQMDFQQEDLANAYVTDSTKTSKDEDEKIDPNTPIDKLQNDIKEYEANKSGVLEYKDLLKQAEFIITLLDTTLSMFFKWLAKDTSSSAYSMPAQNKKLLSEQLALILAKYQTTFKVEYRFFAGLLILYAPMTFAAVKTRKEKVKKPEKKIDLQKQSNLEDKNNNVVDETKQEKILEEVNVPIKKRKPGGQKKV